MWAGVGVSLIFILFRVYVRLTVFRRLFIDDACLFAAWLMFLAYAIIWQQTYHFPYTSNRVSLGEIPLPADFVSQVYKYTRADIGVTLLNTIGLWAIKLSFVLFFRKLGQNVAKQRVLWWMVVGALIVGFAVVVGCYDWPCMIRPVEEIIGMPLLHIGQNQN